MNSNSQDELRKINEELERYYKLKEKIGGDYKSGRISFNFYKTELLKIESKIENLRKKKRAIYSNEKEKLEALLKKLEKKFKAKEISLESYKKHKREIKRRIRSINRILNEINNKPSRSEHLGWGSILMLIFVLIIAGMFIIDRTINQPQPVTEVFEAINTTQEPLQIPYMQKEPIIKEIEDMKLRIYPVAKFKASVMVVSKKFYPGALGFLASKRDKILAKISPVDLCVVWGELAEPEYSKYVNYWQSGRWCYFRVAAGSPFTTSYVYTHFANIHVIPANENIYRAIENIKIKQKVVMEGYLVNVEADYDGEKLYWRTSLTRNDRGYGSCELFYVKRIRIGEKIYE